MQSESPSPAFFPIASAYLDGFSYAYAPSIIVQNGTYHVFFCSRGFLDYPSWDSVRYTASTDGHTWSTPKVLLQATATNGMDLAACDPSVVLYQGFYYMYYSSAITTAPNLFQTVIQVARSVNIDGPYLTYTQRGTWDDTPTDPQVIIYPLEMHDTNPTGYGAGQTTVVALNGKLLIWYSDDSLFSSGEPNLQTFMLESTNPVTWTPEPSHVTNLNQQDSIDVKYEPSKAQFVMIKVENEFTSTAYLGSALSKDGMTWDMPGTIIGSSQFPPYTHDVGMAGDETGNIIAAEVLVGFGAPYVLQDVNNWGMWDLYGVYVNLP